MTGRRWVAVAAPALLLTASVVLVGMHLAHGGGDLPSGWYVVLVCGVSFATVGGLVVWRRPQHRLGWLLVALGAVVCTVPVLELYTAYSEHVHGLPLVQWVGLLSVFTDAGLIPLLTLIFLLFPDGVPPAGGWRRLTGVTVAVGGLRMLAMAFAPGHLSDTGVTNPVALPLPWLHRVDGVLNVASLPLLLAAVALVLLRWRRSTGLARAQFKCLAVAAATWPLVIVPLVLLPTRVSDSVFGESLFGVAVVAIAVGIGVAVLRYRLYDIDRVISRTVSYALVTGLLVGVYVGCVALTTRLLPFSSSFGVAASTLVAAALFQPLRRRVQSAVDRRFNRARYDAARVAEQFSARLRDEVELDTVRADLLWVVGHSVAPAHASLWVAP